MDVSAKNIISGTWGELWLNDELVAEAFKFNAKVGLNKEDVPMCGKMWTDQKVKNVKGTGSMGLYKIYSRMARLVADDLRQGRDPRFTAISKIADPDGLGTERVVVKDISFDDLTLADWEAGVFGKTEHPFTFGDYEYLDRIA